MIQTLKSLSCAAIRQNWNDHIETGIIDSPLYDIIWDDWENKFTECKRNTFYRILKNFVMGEHIGWIQPASGQYVVLQESESRLVIKGLDSYHRKQVHSLCDSIGLHHQSVLEKNNKYKKHLWIYKPKVWRWEYTERNPYSESEECYKQREQLQIQKRENYKEKMKQKYCNGCYSNGWEKQLYCSPHIYPLYCEDCLETLSDGDGGILGDHKFEPI